MLHMDGRIIYKNLKDIYEIKIKVFTVFRQVFNNYLIEQKMLIINISRRTSKCKSRYLKSIQGIFSIVTHL